MQRFQKRCIYFKKLFLSLSNGNFAELLEVFHKIKGSLAGASAGSFVSFVYLCFCICLELCEFSVDFFNKCFHDFVVFKRVYKKVIKVSLQKSCAI